MKNTIALCTIAAALLVSTIGIATAQQATTTQQTTTTTTTADNDAGTTATDTHANVRTLTGCLQKGDSANEYSLAGQNGSTWELKSDTIDLALPRRPYCDHHGCRPACDDAWHERRHQERSAGARRRQVSHRTWPPDRDEPEHGQQQLLELDTDQHRRTERVLQGRREIECF